jgi:hypothetical protein
LLQELREKGLLKTEAAAWPALIPDDDTDSDGLKPICLCKDQEKDLLKHIAAGCARSKS